MIYLLPSRSLKLARSRLAALTGRESFVRRSANVPIAVRRAMTGRWRVSGMARRASGRALTCLWCLDDARVARGEAPRLVGDRLWNATDWWRQLSDAIATRGDPTFDGGRACHMRTQLVMIVPPCLDFADICGTRSSFG